MESKQIRLMNLLELARKHRNGAEFCQKIGMNPSYFSQLKTGRKTIGDELARRVEKTLGLPRAYLDTQRQPAESGSEPVKMETLSVAYALERLSPTVKESVFRLIYTLAAEMPEARSEATVAPFSITIGGKIDDEGSAVQTEAAGG